MISITVNEQIYVESVWLFGVIFNEVLELEQEHIVLKSASIHNYVIRTQDSKSIQIDASLMLQLCAGQQSVTTVLGSYFSSEQENEDRLKKILHDPDSYLETMSSSDVVQIDFDVIGLVYCFLSGAHERDISELDMHDRVTLTSSILSKITSCELPIVDIISAFLGDVVNAVGGGVKKLSQRDNIFVTCDVDNPYELYTSNQKEFIKRLGGDLLKRKSSGQFFRTLSNYWHTGRKDYSFDPNNTFDWMMDINEKAGNRMAFYFLVDRSVPVFDAHYSIDESRIRQLMSRIYSRGHEIGLHASYGTYKNPVQMKNEADKLRQVMEEENIKQDKIGSRQHYLRWATPETSRCLEAAGIAYDTTLGYSDHAGFRCGTSHEFPMFDVENKKVLNIRQKPLIMMESTVLNSRYMNRGYRDETLGYMKSLKDACYLYGGVFTMLWHNSHLSNDRDKEFYRELVNQ